MRGEATIQDSLFRDLPHEAEQGKRIKGKTDLVTIARGPADSPELVHKIAAECYPYGLNIRHLIASGTWQVSHTRTGYAVGPKLPSQAAARAFCHLLRGQRWNDITFARQAETMLEKGAVEEALSVVLGITRDEARRRLEQ